MVEMSAEAAQAVDLVRKAWPATRARLDGLGVLSRTVPNNCILATATALAVLQAEYGVVVGSLACDLYSKDSETREYTPTVVHPDSGSPVEGDGYNGHVVAVIEDGGSKFLFDAELDVVAPMPTGTVFAKSADGAEYMYLAKPDQAEYRNSQAWDRYRQAAPILVEAIAQQD